MRDRVQVKSFVTSNLKYENEKVYNNFTGIANVRPSRSSRRSKEEGRPVVGARASLAAVRLLSVPLGPPRLLLATVVIFSQCEYRHRCILRSSPKLQTSFGYRRWYAVEILSIAMQCHGERIDTSLQSTRTPADTLEQMSFRPFRLHFGADFYEQNDAFGFKEFEFVTSSGTLPDARRAGAV
ncbi:hypothetical protein EVAR_100998_1 [Eumeta japonica]|uniref:Uncharacterized protein n=1 Tax=Eumeta variegata TaxID=151549 RepID=A0A4C2ADW5_EUMVA|nr:hypothetical protein EVAR_100998_1 [Eumeta japonica]